VRKLPLSWCVLILFINMNLNCSFFCRRPAGVQARGESRDRLGYGRPITELHKWDSLLIEYSLFSRKFLFLLIVSRMSKGLPNLAIAI